MIPIFAARASAPAAISTYYAIMHDIGFASTLLILRARQLLQKASAFENGAALNTVIPPRLRRRIQINWLSGVSTYNNIDIPALSRARLRPHHGMDRRPMKRVIAMILYWPFSAMPFAK